MKMTGTLPLARLGVLLLGVLLLGMVLAMPAAAQPCSTPYNGGNGPRSLFLNLHNCGLDCWLQEVPYLRHVQDGVTGVRVAPVTLDNTSPGDPRFFTVNDFDPYFEDVFEIFGPEKTLVLIDDGVDEGAHAKPTPNDILRKLSSLLVRWPRVRHVEFMNEPLNFSNVTPEEYVGRYLRPARELVDRFNQDRAAGNRILLYSAAWFGSEEGVRQTRRMIRAGGLAYVDVLSAHIYERRAADAAERALDYRRLARGKPVAVTEANYNAGNHSDYETQPWWICEAMTEMEQILRRGLSPEQELLQQNVFYTLRGDEGRQFNLIRFADAKALSWANTGTGHIVLTERSKVPTDPKGPVPPDDGGEDDGGGGELPGGGGPIERPGPGGGQD